MPAVLQHAPQLRPHQLDLIRRTIAQDCSRAEFDLFIETAQRYGLDPFRRQIMPLVFSKDRPDKRRMVIIVGIDGQTDDRASLRQLPAGERTNQVH